MRQAPVLTVWEGRREGYRPAADERVVSLAELYGWLTSGRLLHHLGRYQRVTLVLPRLESCPRPLFLALLLRLLSRGRVELRDRLGRTVVLTGAELARRLGRLLRDCRDLPGLLRWVRRCLAPLETPPLAKPAPAWDRPPLYLRTDLWEEVVAGGSVAHTAGVVNNLGRFLPLPVVASSGPLPLLDPDLEVHLIPPGPRFRDFRDLPDLYYNRTLLQELPHRLGRRRPGFIYQRYSAGNFTGLHLARSWGVPLVLEYNGSALWIARHWGFGVSWPALLERIELADLRGADLVVVVSRASAEEVVGRGVAQERVLVNPNGVDLERYSPRVDGSAVRRRYGLEGKTVIGFIGTFGPWHGAEVLARAFARMLEQRPELRASCRLLMVGDGLTRPRAQEILIRAGLAEAAVFTGLLPQTEGPRHLAACDILVSPHVPNPDGTPFFGSPTKVFEYMAMGRPILASRLGQIGEVLEHGHTAWLVPPGDHEALARGILHLLDNPELAARLAAAARARAEERHGWPAHTRRIVERLRELAG